MRGAGPVRTGRDPGLGTRWHAAAAATYLALAAYGSLVPLHFRPRPLEEVLEHFGGMARLGPTTGSRSDWAVNILLFVPLGYLAAGALRSDRPRVGRASAVVLVAFVAFVCASTIEFAQEFFPPRIPSPNDVIGLTLGAAIGSCLWLAAGEPLTSWYRGLMATRSDGGMAGRLLPAYLLLLVAVQLMPLDLATSPVELVRKYREGRIRPIPFSEMAADPGAGAAKAIQVVVGFLPLGWLASRRRWPGRRPPRQEMMAALGIGWLVAGSIEVAQAVVLTRFADSTDVLIGGLAVASGWWIGRGSSRSESGPWTPTARFVALGLWATAAVVTSWQPFHFDRRFSSASGRLRGLVGVPFADYQAGNEYHAFDQALHKALLFAALGVILASSTAGSRRGVGPVGIAFAAGLAAIVLETGQAFLPGRYPSLSDVLVGALGGWIGAEATSRAFGPARDPGMTEGMWTR